MTVQALNRIGCIMTTINRTWFIAKDFAEMHVHREHRSGSLGRTGKVPAAKSESVARETRVTSESRQSYIIFTSELRPRYVRDTSELLQSYEGYTQVTPESHSSHVIVTRELHRVCPGCDYTRVSHACN